jgi:hypothetical protein
MFRSPTKGILISPTLAKLPLRCVRMAAGMTSETTNTGSMG